VELPVVLAQIIAPTGIAVHILKRVMETDIWISVCQHTGITGSFVCQFKVAFENCMENSRGTR
jgi:hypothetical protein